MSKSKHVGLTLSDKLRLVNDHDSGKSREELANAFNVSLSTVYRIINTREKVESECSEGHGKLKRFRPSDHPEVEKCLVEWLKQCLDKNISVSGPFLKEKARSFAVKLNCTNFNASNGWLDGFKKRHDLAFKKICGESKAVDETVSTQWLKDLPSLLDGYSPDDVFNADETGLFYKCLPTKTFTFKGQECHGGKMSKERITVLLCANSSGSEKLPLLIIGKSKKPRCFKNVKTLPVEYTNNKKAWMTRDIFTDWLKSVDRQMKLKKRKIVMFVDNCTAHSDLPQLNFVKVLFLPANTTSKLQPLDQGIIQNFKVLYRTEIVHFMERCMEDGVNEPEVNLLQAMRYA
jgi:hypothetical protein